MTAEARRIPVLLIGAGGMLGGAVARRRPGGVDLVPLDRAALDITDADAVEAAIGRHAPAVVINCAGYTDVDGCETAPELARAVNGEAPGTIATAAAAAGARSLHISTDYVFDGEKEEPYLEIDPPAPRSVYGASKLAGEDAVLAASPDAAWIVRTSWLYGAGGSHFPATIARLARERAELTVVDDQHGNPTWTADLADAIWRIVGAGGRPPAPPGIYHVAGQGEATWYDLAVAVVVGMRARGARLAVEKIRPVPTEEFPRPAERPRNSRLSTARYTRETGATPLPWERALEAYLDGEGARELELEGAG